MTCENQPKYTWADSRGWDWPKASRVLLTGADCQPKTAQVWTPKTWWNVGQSRLTFWFSGARAQLSALTHSCKWLGWLPGKRFTSALLLLLPHLMALPSAWYTEVFVGQVGFVLTAPPKNPCWDLLALFPVCSEHLPHFLSRLQCAAVNTRGCKLNSCRAFSQ